jgi:predicted dehydrogenase
MRILVVGLGSMGKRRIRCLQALGETELAGLDTRSDRRAEASSRYGVGTFESLHAALEAFKPAAMIISTGPAHHMDYAIPAAERGIHCFIEASVVDADRIAELRAMVAGRDIVVAPSCTMRYFPGPRAVKDIARSGRIGRPVNLNYHVGQYLPDWHPWEAIQDFYVSSRDTGGARELVPFELTWLNEVFGKPRPLACVKTKVTDLDADIDDVYHCILQYPDGLIANVTIDVVSRPRATRELRLLGTDGMLVFSTDDSAVRSIRVGEEGWETTPLPGGTVASGYINPEEPYIEELGDFLRAVGATDSSLFPNSLGEDIEVLNLTYELERLSRHLP